MQQHLSHSSHSKRLGSMEGKVRHSVPRSDAGLGQAKGETEVSYTLTKYGGLDLVTTDTGEQDLTKEWGTLQMMSKVFPAILLTQIVSHAGQRNEG